MNSTIEPHITMLNPASISAVMITKNSQLYLKDCLNALRDFDEIILLDNGSTDQTLVIAGAYPNVKIYSSPFIGFGALKNLAASYASHDWIFSVDSDEIVSEELIEHLAQLKLQPNEVGVIFRKNYYRQKWINACGWQNDYLVRIYNRTQTRFSDKRVHEGIISDQLRKVTLNGCIYHYSYRNVSELIAKMQHYSSLFAEENRHKKSSSPLKAAWKGWFAFIKSYFFKKGILYGYEGFVISVVNACTTFFKYIKLHEANRK